MLFNLVLVTCDSLKGGLWSCWAMNLNHYTTTIRFIGDGLEPSPYTQ
jgi:hypothetical protein